jgi:hypothetical protein
MPVSDLNGNPFRNGSAHIQVDRTKGTNGEKANVTVTPLAFNSMGVIYLEIISTLGGAHYLPVLIGNK